MSVGMIKLKRDTTLWLIQIIYTLVLLLLFIINENYIKTYNGIFVLSTISYILFLIELYFKDNDLITLFSFFVILTYFFYYGQFLVESTGNDIYGILNIHYIYSRSEYIKTALFTLVAVSTLICGYLSPNFSINNSRNTFRLKSVSKEKLSKVAIILLLIGYVPALYESYQKAMVVLRSGYSEMFNSAIYSGSGINKIIRELSGFAVPGLLLGLITSRNSSREKYYWILCFTYIGVYFLSGSRYRGLLLICAFILYYHQYKSDNKITLKKILLLAIIVLSVLLIASIIPIIRSSGISSGNSTQFISNVFNETLKTNYLANFISSIGSTAATNTTVLANCPSQVNFVYGKSYIYSLMKTLPDLFGLWNNYKDVDTVFHSFITPNSGIGSSFIAEGYYNFGYFSIILFYIFGCLFKNLERKRKRYVILSNDVKAENYFYEYLYFYLSSLVLFYVRADTYGFTRNLFVCFLIPYFIATK